MSAKELDAEVISREAIKETSAFGVVRPKTDAPSPANEQERLEIVELIAQAREEERQGQIRKV